MNPTAADSDPILGLIETALAHGTRPRRAVVSRDFLRARDAALAREVLDASARILAGLGKGSHRHRRRRPRPRRKPDAS